MDIFCAKTYFPTQDPEKEYKIYVLDYENEEQLIETKLTVKSSDICDMINKSELFPSSFVPTYVWVEDVVPNEVLIVEIPIWVFWISKLF